MLLESGQLSRQVVDDVSTARESDTAPFYSRGRAASGALPGRPAVRYLLSTGPMPSTGRHVHVELVGCSLVAITGLRGLDGPAVAALSCSPPGALPEGRRGDEPRQG